MKRSILLPIIFLLFAGTSFYCHPKKVNPDHLTGKLVINGACGQYVVQVVSGSIDPKRIASSWTDTFSHITYTNVFRVANSCTFGGEGVAKDQLFTFTIPDPGPVQDCFLCQIYVPTPPVSTPVTNVQVLK